jgi:hypothetical protein
MSVIHVFKQIFRAAEKATPPPPQCCAGGWGRSGYEEFGYIFKAVRIRLKMLYKIDFFPF